MNFAALDLLYFMQGFLSSTVFSRPIHGKVQRKGRALKTTKKKKTYRAIKDTNSFV